MFWWRRLREHDPAVGVSHPFRRLLGHALIADSLNQRPPLLAGLCHGHDLAISDRALAREEISFDQPVFDPARLDLLELHRRGWAVARPVPESEHLVVAGFHR